MPPPSTTARIVVRLAPRRRAPRDARPRRARAASRDAAHRRPGRAARRSPGVMGGADVRGRARARPTSSSSRRSSIRSASAGRRSATPSGPRRACGSRRARSTDSRGSAPTARPGSSPSGPAATVAPGAVDTNPTEPPPARVAFRPARVNRLLGTTFGTDEQRDAAGAGRRRDGAGAAGRRVVGRGRSAAARRGPGDGRGPRGDRPDLAARPRDRGGRRRGGRPRPRLRAGPDILPDTPMPPYRHDPLELRDAVRETLAGAGLTEVVTSRSSRRAMVERFPALEDGAIDGDGAAAERPGRWSSPTRCRASTRSCARA